MNAAECLQILREVKDVAFATVDENGNPQVRIIDVMIVEDEKLFFCTARGKEFHKELLHSSRVAITGLNKEFKSVRLMGKVERLKDQKFWIDRIFEENPVMNGVYPGDCRYILDAFCVKDGEVEFFDLGQEPINRASLSIGDAAKREQGFLIQEDCIGCGTCEAACPQQCIEEGQPYVIHQDHCLHCGICFENCPADAIKRIE